MSGANHKITDLPVFISSPENLASVHWMGSGNLEVSMDFFLQLRMQVKSGDNEGALKSLTRIISIAGLDANQYLHAYYLLNELVAFSDEYFELYGDNVDSRN